MTSQQKRHPAAGVRVVGGRSAKFAAFVATLTLLFGVNAAPAAANVRIFPQEIPFYANINDISGTDLQVTRTDEWAAITFYRPPECVPTDFNLLDFFDVPRVFGCGPMTVKHHAVFENGPETDPGPIHTRMLGLGAVPIWFVSWAELEAAVASRKLTIGELASLPSLMVGSADLYSETLNPGPVARVPRDVIAARGSLDDGRAFRLHAVESAGGLSAVHITFG